MAVVYDSDGDWSAVLRSGLTKLMVLRALFEGPGHGYALVRRIEATTGGFVAPRYGGIYPILRQFERAGCIRHRVEARGRRLSKVYELTPRGRKALNAGLSACERAVAVMQKAIDLR